MSEISESGPQAFPCFGNDGSVSGLSTRLQEYSTRQLSFAGDFINAFFGIFTPFDVAGLGNVRAAHFYGIPIFNRTFDDTVLATSSSLRHLQWNIGIEELDLEWKSNIFPSWSTKIQLKMLNLRIR